MSSAAKKILNAKFFLCLFLSIFAATGVIMYGYQFPELLTTNKYFSIPVGILCAATAMIANLMLGTYSLLVMKTKKSEKINWLILITSLVGSVPYGFLCFFGYQKILPAAINVTLSIIVVIVNSGIGYTAIKGVLKSLTEYFGKEKLRYKIPVTEQLVRITGIVIGLIISITMYLATCHGLADLFKHFQFDKLIAMHAAYYMAFISWVPVAALFANGNQTVANDLYQKCKTLPKTLAATNGYSIAFIFFCLFSGGSIAAMMHDSFDNSKKIPDLFKMDLIQFTVNHYLFILALFSSAALNYFAINKLREYFSK
jgi:hypothetical protein